MQITTSVLSRRSLGHTYTSFLDRPLNRNRQFIRLWVVHHFYLWGTIADSRFQALSSQGRDEETSGVNKKTREKKDEPEAVLLDFFSCPPQFPSSQPTECLEQNEITERWVVTEKRIIQILQGKYLFPNGNIAVSDYQTIKHVEQRSFSRLSPLFPTTLFHLII